MSKLSESILPDMQAKERDYKLSDGEGLYILVRPTGTKLWRMNYRYLGLQRTVTFGRWPYVDLDEARDKRREARRLIASGRDP